MKFDVAQLQTELQKQRSLGQNLPEFQIYLFDQVTSTNTVLWQLLSQGTVSQPIPPTTTPTVHPAILSTMRWTVAIALQQTTGRGQRGRNWISPEGGLYLSVAIAPDLLASEGSQLTLCSAIGIADILRDRDIPVQIKWLNDLVVEGRKIGGILTESRLHRGRITQAVIGVGINWSNPVPAPGINLQTLFAQSQKPTIPSLETLAALILTGLANGFLALKKQGITNLLPTYEALLTNLGQTIAIDHQIGKVVGISSTGHLRVSLNPAEDQRPEPQPPDEQKSDQPAAEDQVLENSIAAEILLEPGSVQLGYNFNL